jgi:uncharacterized protein YbjT (DUF2867 family)
MNEPGPKKAVLLGATGLVGGQLLGILLESEAYGQVVTITRKPLPEHRKLKQVVVTQLDEMSEHNEIFVDANDVFCCLGTTIKKAGSQAAFRKVDYDYPVLAARLAKEFGAQRFLIVTAMGANAASKIFYSRVKGEAEAAIRELQLPAVSIMRPSLLLGDRGEFRLGEAIASWLSKPLAFLLGGPLLKARPIEGRTVAAVMHRMAQMYLPGTHVYENDQLHKLGN